MKRSMTTLMLATAALMVASTVASAGDLTANIQFAFHVSGKVMAPGNYRVVGASGETGFQLRNVTTGETVLLGSGLSQDPREEWKGSRTGVWEFTCGDRGCALRQIWTNDGYAAHAYSAPKPEDGMSARVALIRVAIH